MKSLVLSCAAAISILSAHSAAHAGGISGGGPVVIPCTDDDGNEIDCPVPGDGDSGTPASPGSPTTPKSPGSNPASGGTGTGSGSAVAPSATTTITFDQLARNSALSNYVEGDYDVKLVAGSIVGGFGQSTPSANNSVGLDTVGPAAETYVPGSATPEFSVTRTDGGAFSVDSFFSVLLSDNGVNSVTIQGFNNGVMGGSSTVDSTFHGFGFPQLTNLAGTYDRVLFTLASLPDANGPSSGMSFDSLTVTAAPAVSAAPEPGMWMMMILGFGLVGGVMRSAFRKSEDRFTRKVQTTTAA